MMQVIPVHGIGEVDADTDLAAVIRDAASAGPSLHPGDVVVVTSKAVAKAEGQVFVGGRDDFLPGETVRVVARRGQTTIVENQQGLVMAAAGIDASNVASGHVVLLPRNPDASARALRKAWAAPEQAAGGVNVAVLIADTVGRPWREGQTDIAIGAAGIEPLELFAGREDAYGNPLVVTAPAVADELTASAELVSGKLGGCPAVIIRGLAERVLPPGVDGPGARALQRPHGQDLFALGAREAVVAAIAGEQADAFGTPATVDDFTAALDRLGVAWSCTTADVPCVRTAGNSPPGNQLRVLAFAHGWQAAPDADDRLADPSDAWLTWTPRPSD